MAFTKVTELTSPISTLPDRVSGSAADLKARFDASPNQLKNAHNALCDELAATAAAGNIGAQAVPGVTGNTVQAILAGLKTAIDAIVSGVIPPSSVDEGMLQDGAVTGAKIAAGVVSTAKIEDSAITAAKILAGAISTAKLADGAVTGAKVSTEIEKRPVRSTATLAAANWVGTSAPFSYSLAVTGVTASGANESDQTVLLARDATAAQVKAWDAANVKGAGQAAGFAYLKAHGSKPTTDIPVEVLVTGGVYA